MIHSVQAGTMVLDYDILSNHESRKIISIVLYFGVVEQGVAKTGSHVARLAPCLCLLSARMTGVPYDTWLNLCISFRFWVIATENGRRQEAN